MAPLRPTARTRLRQPVRIHPSRQPSNTERFWIDYAAVRSEDGIFEGQQTERFWLELVQRPRSTRATSLPPTPTLSTAKTTVLAVPDAKCPLKRIFDGAITKIGNGRRRLCRAVTSLRDGTSRLFGMGLRRNGVGNRMRRRILRATLLGSIIYLYLNYSAAVARDTAPSAVLDQYYRFPTWMHVDPVQVLGFPPSVSTVLVPNKIQIKKQFTKFRATWTLDRWQTRGFRTLEDAKLAMNRGLDASNILDKWYENPFCANDTKPLYDRYNSTFVYKDGLPSFANPCRCTYPYFILKQIKAALVPAFLQPKVPQTEAEISTFCPCTMEIAHASWASFAIDPNVTLASSSTEANTTSASSSTEAGTASASSSTETITSSASSSIEANASSVSEVDRASAISTSSAKHAKSTSRSFPVTFRPPYIRRIALALHPGRMLDWRVRQYMASQRDQNLPYGVKDEKPCLEGKHPLCKDMAGWLVPGDVDPSERSCKTDAEKRQDKAWEEQMEQHNGGGFMLYEDYENPLVTL